MHAANNLIQKKALKCSDWKRISTGSNQKYEEVQAILTGAATIQGYQNGPRFTFTDTFNNQDWLYLFNQAQTQTEYARTIKDEINKLLQDPNFWGFWISFRVKASNKPFNHATVMTMRSSDGKAWFLDSQSCPGNDKSLSFSVNKAAPNIQRAISELATGQKRNYAKFQAIKIWVVKRKIVTVQVTPNKIKEGCKCSAKCGRKTDRPTCSCLAWGCIAQSENPNQQAQNAKCSNVQNSLQFTAAIDTGMETAKKCKIGEKAVKCTYTVDCSSYQAHTDLENELMDSYYYTEDDDEYSAGYDSPMRVNSRAHKRVNKRKQYISAAVNDDDYDYYYDDHYGHSKNYRHYYHSSNSDFTSIEIIFFLFTTTMGITVCCCSVIILILMGSIFLYKKSKSNDQ